MKVLISIFFIVNIHCNNFLISDFLTQQNVPTKITAFLCFNKEHTLKLFKAVFDNGCQISINTKFDDGVFESRELDQNHQLFLIDLNCSGAHYFLIKAQHRKAFKHPYRWLAWSHQGVNDFNILSNISISVDSQFFVANITDGIVNLTSIYKIAGQWEVIRNEIGAWLPSSGFNHFNHLDIPRRRNNLQGLNINIPFVLADLDSLNHLWDYRNTQVDFLTKMNYILVHHLLDFMNATGNFILERKWSTRNSSKDSYDSILGKLETGLAEIGGMYLMLLYIILVCLQPGSPFVLLHDRIYLLDYTGLCTPAQAKIVFRAPPLSQVKNMYSITFDTLVWCVLLALAILASLIFYLIAIWESKKSKGSNQCPSRRANFIDSLLVVISGISQQGSKTEPLSLSGKIAFIFYLLALMFLYTSFSGNIVSMLQSTSNSIQTLEHVLKSRLQVGAENQTYMRYLYSTLTEPILRAIYQKKIAPPGQEPNYFSKDEGVAKIRNEFFAFHGVTSTIYTIVAETFYEHEKCSLRELQFWKLAEPCLAVRKNSDFKEIMKVGLNRIVETGLHKREVNKFFRKKPVCRNQGSNFVSVGLIECYCAFVIFGCGAGLSIILLLSELASKRYAIQRRNTP